MCTLILLFFTAEWFFVFHFFQSRPISIHFAQNSFSHYSKPSCTMQGEAFFLDNFHDFSKIFMLSFLVFYIMCIHHFCFELFSFFPPILSQIPSVLIVSLSKKFYHWDSFIFFSLSSLCAWVFPISSHFTKILLIINLPLFVLTVISLSDFSNNIVCSLVL